MARLQRSVAPARMLRQFGNRSLKGSRPIVFQQTPVYDRLVAERGDIPVQVRGEADRIHRDLAEVMRRTSSSWPSARQNVVDPKAPPAAR